MIANYHTHTWRCNHAEGKEEDYVRNAIARGLKTLGFSDHSPYIFPEGYVSTFRMKMDQLDDYVSEVMRLRTVYQTDIEIPLGVELEYYPELLPELLEQLRDRPIEYAILGQHYLGNEIAEHYNGRPTTDVSLLRRYTHQSAEGMNTGLFSYFAHPDLFNFVGERSVYQSYMRQICREANSCHMPLEINFLGIRARRNYPNPDFWRVAAEENCTVIFGCDAHDPQAMLELESEEKARRMVEEYGLRLVEQIELRHI